MKISSASRNGTVNWDHLKAKLTMTTKFKALCFAIGAAVSGTLSYIAEMPPSLQSDITMVFPEHYRGGIGLSLRILAGICTVASAHQASHSGPSSPPANSPNE